MSVWCYTLLRQSTPNSDEVMRLGTSSQLCLDRRWSSFNLFFTLGRAEQPCCRPLRARGHHCLTPDDKLLDDTWAEGGMLLDLDARRLLFWGGMQFDTHPYLRRAFFKVLPSLWPNWSVAWSVFGVADLARAVGMDVAPLIFSTVHHDRFLAGDEPDMSREQLLEALKTGNASTAFTIRWKDGRLGIISLALALLLTRTANVI